MKIISLTFKNRLEEWEVKKIEFSSISLLVGASGVGKTQILDAIHIVGEIASGKSFPGVSWDLKFSGEKNELYSWSGRFSLVTQESLFQELEESDSKSLGSLTEEQLICINDEIFTRNARGVLINGENSKLQFSLTESLFFTLRNEKGVSGAYKSLRKIHSSDYLSSYKISNTLQGRSNLPSRSNRSTFRFLMSDKNQKIQGGDLLSFLPEMEYPVPYKLALINKYSPNEFAEIQKTFCKIFPTVTAIKISTQESIKGFSSSVTLKVSIKEKGVSRLVPQERISNGMLKTLFLIAEIQLMEPGSVFIIDEFENGLGINCIDVLTNEVLDPTNNIQFIITSHHPYIINNVPVKDWKIITRNKGEILNYSAEEIGIGKSKHEAFIQLINSNIYNPR